MPEEDETPFHPIAARQQALATLVGVLIGALRAKGTLLPEEVEQVFQISDGLLSPRAAASGSMILSVIRDAAASVRAS